MSVMAYFVVMSVPAIDVALVNALYTTLSVPIMPSAAFCSHQYHKMDISVCHTTRHKTHWSVIIEGPW